MMRKLFMLCMLFFAVVMGVQAAGVSNPYDNRDALSRDEQLKQQVTNAAELTIFRNTLEQVLATQEMPITKRAALKTVLNKVKKAQKVNGSLNSLLMTLGIILIIVGVIALILSLVVWKHGAGYGGGGGLIVLGLLLYLVGKFVDL